MSADTRTPSRRPLHGILFLLVTGLIAFAAPLAAATPAFAHDELLSSDPAADAVLAEAPGQVTLTFSADLITGEGATEVQVLDAAGTAVGDGDAVTEGTSVTQPLAADLGNGAYRVLWKVVSSDGHPTSGEFAFTVDAPVATPSASQSETTEPSAEPTAAVPSASEAPSAESVGTSSAVPWVIAGIIAAAVVVAVVYLLAARARRQ
ncbi:MAG TPA: copper resistance CopC family protein, partial [Microbacterium sp.]|uniref:copper resistance CopC family protein n=1 Tax=Microbacterium sp. TaxID=51671 RepID=UPI002BDA5C67